MLTKKKLLLRKFIWFILSYLQNKTKKTTYNYTKEFIKPI